MNGKIYSQHALPTQAGMLHYQLRRSPRRRTVEVRILESAQISVAAPSSASLEKIQKFIFQHADWLSRRQDQMRERLERFPLRRYEHGQEFLFLGKSYPLRVEMSALRQARIHFAEQGWTVHLPDGEADGREALIKKKLFSWYRLQAEEVFGGRIFHFARSSGLMPETIAVKTQKRMWGNCDYRSRKINLNWRLVMAPLAVIDYVVVHELCHLKEPNHSRRFWNQVEQILPGYKEPRDWLKKNVPLLTLP